MMDTNNQSLATSIAVIGMAGRFPQAKNIDEFWQRIVTGTECITQYTESKLIAAGIDPDLLQNPNYVRARGELEGIDRFDAVFFGINPREAAIMDPQHRLLLECGWEALDNAGYDPERFPGRIGIYAGESMNIYVFLNVYPYIEKVLSSGSLQAAIGNDKDSLTTTIAYKLNLKGPAITIQSSSSTSLTAIAIASQSLLNYQCDLALAGGVSVGSPQKSGYLYESRGIVSPDGHCRPFDAGAKGFVPGNGMGLVVLKRLAEAIADGDSILAVIKGYAVNNDGSSKVSYGAPSVDAQAEVVMEAQAVAAVSPDSIGYLEAHGTGTEMGDPIEITALIQAFRAGTNRNNFCALGSVKGNIGHLDTAAGVTGLIKTVLILQHKMIPPNVNFESPNPKIDLDNSPFYISKQLQPWETSGAPRRAGVTSLGMGGTNVHIVLEEAPPLNPSGISRPWHLLLYSAKTENALEQTGKNLANHLDRHPEHELADVAYTLQIGRRHWSHRGFAVCRDHRDAIQALVTGIPGKTTTGRQPGLKKIIYLMTGTIENLAPETSRLYQQEPFFGQQADHCLAVWQSQTELHRNNLNLPPAGPNPFQDLLNQTVHTPWMGDVAVLMVEYALAQLFTAWGISPWLIAGDALGEFCAACLAGVFTLKTALELVALRSRMNHHCTDISPAELNDQYQRALHQHPLNSPVIPFMAAGTGRLITESEATSTVYWLGKLNSTSESGANQSGAELFKDTLIIELGPGQSRPDLTGYYLPDLKILTTVGLKPEAQAVQEQILQVLGEIWLTGLPVDWEGFYALEQRRRVPLPSYPFERQSYWLQPKKSTPAAIDKQMAAAVRLTGKTVAEITGIEKQIAAVWAEVLGFTEFNLEDNFFEIGGDSILLIKLHSLLEGHYPGQITATDLFAYPTITKLARFLSGKGVGAGDIAPAEPPDSQAQILNLLKEGKKGNLSMAEMLQKLNTLEE